MKYSWEMSAARSLTGTSGLRKRRSVATKMEQVPSRAVSGYIPSFFETAANSRRFRSRDVAVGHVIWRRLRVLFCGWFRTPCALGLAFHGWEKGVNCAHG